MLIIRLRFREPSHVHRKRDRSPRCGEGRRRVPHAHHPRVGREVSRGHRPQHDRPQDCCKACPLGQVSECWPGKSTKYNRKTNRMRRSLWRSDRVRRLNKPTYSQICVAPDYILIPRSAQDAFVEAIKEAAKEFHLDDALASDSYGSIVSASHFKRLQSLMQKSSGEIVVGGDTNEEGRRITPTIYRDVKEGDSLLEGFVVHP